MGRGEPQRPARGAREPCHPQDRPRAREPSPPGALPCYGAGAGELCPEAAVADAGVGCADPGAVLNNAVRPAIPLRFFASPRYVAGFKRGGPMLNDPLFIVVAIAVLIVLGILLTGIGGFARGGDFNKKHANRIMRWRIYAQFIAVLLILLFVFIRGSGGN